jgi:transposase InsO family protein
MAKKLTMTTRDELLVRLRERYISGSRVEKTAIAAEFTEISGYHRKHVMRLLRAPGQVGGRSAPRPERQVYDDAVQMALVMLWEAGDRICGKRLVALLPALIPAMERHGHLALDPIVRAKLLKISAASIDRRLKDRREHVKRRRRAAALNHLRRQVPIRTHGDWDNPPPGFFEMDLVAHCGGRMSGAFIWTLSITDVSSGWTECAALIARTSDNVIAALQRIMLQSPIPVLGLDADNDSVFISESFIGWCKQNAIEFTRSRPYKKNDQAFIEQKNGAVVRRLAGHQRFSGLGAVREMAKLYAASRVFVNVFQPSFKLIGKTREGSRVRKRYSAPKSPCDRLIAREDFPEAMKTKLRRWANSADPIAALAAVRHAQERLALIADKGEEVKLAEPPEDLTRFMQGLASAWKAGDPRGTHRPPIALPRHWRTRVDPFVTVNDALRLWLEQAPDLDAITMLHRLQGEHPGQYPNGLLRTLQRRVQIWRRELAQRLVIGNASEVSFNGAEEHFR